MKGRCSVRIMQKQLSALQHAGDSLLIFIQGQRRSKGHTEKPKSCPWWAKEPCLDRDWERSRYSGVTGMRQERD